MKLDIKTAHPRRGTVFGEALGGDYTTDSGLIVISGNKNPWPKTIKVISIGGPFKDGKLPGKYRCKVGDVVGIKKQKGDKITIGLKAYIFIKNEDIVGVE